MRKKRKWKNDTTKCNAAYGKCNVVHIHGEHRYRNTQICVNHIFSCRSRSDTQHLNVPHEEHSIFSTLQRQTAATTAFRIRGKVHIYFHLSFAHMFRIRWFYLQWCRLSCTFAYSSYAQIHLHATLWPHVSPSSPTKQLYAAALPRTFTRSHHE